MRLSKFSTWFASALISMILAAIIISFSSLINDIDQKNITELNSDMVIKASYYIDKNNTITVEKLLNEESFIASELNNIPYTLAKQSYWIKLSLHYPVAKPLSRIDNQPEPITHKHHQQLILMAEHSLLDTFTVFELKPLTPATKIYHQGDNTQELSQNVYPAALLTLNQFGHSEYLIQLKASGPPNIPLLLFTPQDFQQRLLLSQLVYGAFIGILMIMAIYNLVLFSAGKDKVYLFYIGYLLSVFALVSSLKGYGYFLFPTPLMQTLNQHLIFIHFLVIIFLLLFTIYFLRYERIKHWAYKYAIGFAGLLAIFALYSLTLEQIAQAKLFFVLQPLFFIIALLLVFYRINRDFAWARFYFLSWVPFLIGATVQPLVLLNLLEYSFLTANALLFAIMIEVTFMAFALAERIRRHEQSKLSMIAYHQSYQLPRQTNLEHKVTQMIAKSITSFSLLVIRPEQLQSIEQHIDEQTRIKFFQHLFHKLSLLFRFNDAVLTITDNQEKLCYIDNGSFALVINNMESSDDLVMLINSIQQATTEAFAIDALKLPLSAYIGVAHFPEHGSSSTQLINHAIIAATNAESSLTKWANYLPKAQQQNHSSMELAIALQQAIIQKDFELFHQPQVDLKTNKVCSSECLIRWHHPTLGTIAPATFIALAEDLGLMPTLSLWIIETALAQQASLSEKTGLNHMVSINISSKDLIQADFVDNISEIIKHSGIKAEKIIFELSDLMSFGHNNFAMQTINKLVDIGITVSIDDFAGGCDLMSKVTQLPCQELKIDREFVEHVCRDHKRKVIAETTVKMAKGLGLEVVAEGINSSLDEQTLRSFGCDIGQGYYYAKPMSFDDYLTWLNKLSNGQIPASLEGEFLPAEK
ncbi:diguanylate cyclase/phosphodiesterase [Colwellia chukchiensis]|uniref:Diguanylate cyclase/phosphodiesterase n=1 Tax=Colwellia chukchiensis TaxID=641665 RepID=A0A1H7M5Z2_9GAMM|nr:EAL domain-containing protein [Colwellia chukchiensis]SEL06519.1 diguanylate cyclase/phosphodiesterase [Colwellia chukchiensis]